MERMGLYAKYGATYEGITDYAFTYESSNSLDYDGYLNRSLAAYSMDISTWVQSLMMAAQENVDDEGVVDFAKFAEDGEFVGYRRMYIGPDAAQRYGFNRQAIYGTDGEVGGDVSSAPITLDLTYTIVK